MADSPLSNLLPKLTTRGDIAAFGLGYVAGFITDTLFGWHGVTQGQASICGGILVLSVKSAIQAFLESHTNRESLALKYEQLRQLIRQQSGVMPQAEILDLQYQMWRLGLLSAHDFKEKMAQIGQDTITRSQLRSYGGD